MSKTVSAALAGLVQSATAWMSPYRRSISRARVSEALVQVWEEPLEGGTKLRFVCPTARSLHDPATLRNGEPETIRWLDGLDPSSTLWDIGANVGVYSLYAAARGMRVAAFEPSAATFAALTRNVEVNGFGDRISVFCVAFSDKTGIDYLYMADTAAGHSMHAFGQKETVQGALRPAFAQSVPGFSIDDFMDIFKPPPPRHIKLDVDSIESLIILGGQRTLREHVETVLVEIDGTNQDKGGSEIRDALARADFVEDGGFSRPGDRRNVLFRKRSGVK